MRDRALRRDVRGLSATASGPGYHARVSEEPVLVTIELRFRATEDPRQLGERVRESVAMIVGREHLEEFRVRVLPLSPRKPRGV